MSEPMFWDRKGEPIEDVIAWAKLYEDVEYRVVAVDVDDMDPDKTSKMVSTIWNGITGNLFETATIRNGVIEDFVRSYSEEEALHMHDLACQNFLFRDARPEDRVRETIVEREKEAKRGRSEGETD